MPHSFGSFFQILDMASRLGGCGTRVISDLSFKFIRKTKKIKDQFDPQPDYSIQPKAQGLLYMECDFHRIPYKRRVLLEYI
jgi:hypothetical protein